MLFKKNSNNIKMIWILKGSFIKTNTSNVYMINLDQTSNHDQCYLSKDKDPWL